MKYNIYGNDDEPLQYLISGGHFSEEKALEILLVKKIIEKSDNLAVCDVSYGFGRKTIDEDMIEGEEPYPFMWQQGTTNVPLGYKTRVTFVELYEQVE